MDDQDPLFPIPEGGWEYGNCKTLDYAEEDAFAFASEDLDLYTNDVLFVSTGMNGPDGGGVDRSNVTEPYTLGGIYLLDLSNQDSPIFARAKISGLPSSLNFRPHGIFYDENSNRLLVVSHNEQEQEENIVIFSIEDGEGDGSLPTLTFEAALFSDEWSPVGGNLANWHINDLVVAGAEEILVTQWGPINPEDLFPKTLWSCELLASYENLPQDGRIKTTCVRALDFTSPGLNGIAINDARNTAWVSDLFSTQLLEINKNDDVAGNWTLNTTISTPGAVDNLVFIDGTLHMAVVTKVLTFDSSFYIGTYAVASKRSSSDAFVTEPVFQFDPSFLEELDFPFITSMAYPVGDLVVLGSVTYPGIVICSRNVTDNESDGVMALYSATVSLLVSLVVATIPWMI